MPAQQLLPSCAPCIAKPGIINSTVDSTLHAEQSHYKQNIVQLAIDNWQALNPFKAAGGVDYWPEGPTPPPSMQCLLYSKPGSMLPMYTHLLPGIGHISDFRCNARIAEQHVAHRDDCLPHL